MSNMIIVNVSSGIIILEGYFNGRDVSIKHIVRTYYEASWTKIEILISLDQHLYIAKWYGWKLMHNLFVLLWRVSIVV